MSTTQQAPIVPPELTPEHVTEATLIAALEHAADLLSSGMTYSPADSARCQAIEALVARAKQKFQSVIQVVGSHELLITGLVHARDSLAENNRTLRLDNEELLLEVNRQRQRVWLMEAGSMAGVSIAENDGWTRVEDGLPDDEVAVWAWHEHYEDIAMGFIAHRNGQLWLDEDGDEITVSFWRHLPAPPTSRGDGRASRSAS